MLFKPDYNEATGYFSLAECSAVQAIQSTLNDIHQIVWLKNIVKWANIMCTAYDVAMEIRSVMLGEATVGDVVAAIVKGVAVGLLANGLCGTVLGIVLKPIMAVFGLGSQVQQIQEAIESGDPAEITVRVVQLLCMLFGLTAQCFTGDTLVATEDGLKPIEEVEEGECVWSEDTETGEKELKKVVSVSVTETAELVHVFVGEEEIRTTEFHPFFVEGEGWKAAGELVAGDVLRTEDGKERTVGRVEVERLSVPVKVYNLEIEDSHVYYVSGAGVLVHNVCGDVTEDTIKETMKDAPLKTQQKSVSIPVIQNYFERILNGEVDLPAIKVDGDIIVDGNHRYIASLLAGIKIDIIQWRGGNPDKVLSWDDVIYDIFDWGNR